MDFSKTLIRCSCLGALFTEPKEKAAKERGDLSETAKSYLIKVYIKEKYGRETEIVAKEMTKGRDVEEEAIALFSQLEGKVYQKNIDRLQNEYIIGTPDIKDGEIWDVKAPWNLETFLSNVNKPLNKDYLFQLQGYYWLSDLETGGIAYLLMNTPESLINAEKYRLLCRMDVATEENDAYKLEAAKLEYSMLFDDIDPKERCLKFVVPRNEEIIAQIPQKVEKARLFLQEFQEKHLAFNKFI